MDGVKGSFRARMAFSCAHCRRGRAGGRHNAHIDGPLQAPDALRTRAPAHRRRAGPPARRALSCVDPVPGEEPSDASIRTDHPPAVPGAAGRVRQRQRQRARGAVRRRRRHRAGRGRRRTRGPRDRSVLGRDHRHLQRAVGAVVPARRPAAGQRAPRRAEAGRRGQWPRGRHRWPARGGVRRPGRLRRRGAASAVRRERPGLCQLCRTRRRRYRRRCGRARAAGHRRRGRRSPRRPRSDLAAGAQGHRPRPLRASHRVP